MSTSQGNKAGLKKAVAKALQFFTDHANGDNKRYFSKICKHYDIIDVDGDGNCGPYTMILGSINRGTLDMSKVQNCKTSMNTNIL